ncbi:MAG: dienelactone hydrolase family protein, partial [Rhizobacter sp.]|nr:dienelactone hydrolase family protein [Bacteriovorax sp.]
FADEGYLAIAPELFHRTAPPGFTAGYDQFNSVMDHFTAITTQGLIQDSQACFDWLKENGAESIAVIGHCLGGRVSFVVNSALPVKCAISYYGGRIATMNLDLAADQKSPLLFFWGNLDQHIPNDQIQSINSALTAAKKKFTCVQFSDADHGFFCDERPSYNPQAARESWAMTLQFLKENM